MKPGDKFNVNLNEHVVAEAVVIDIEDGKVTLDIPATRIVMGVKSSLTDLPDTLPDTERQIIGTQDDQGVPVSQNVATQPAPQAPQAPKATDENSTAQVSPASQSEPQETVPEQTPIAKPGIAPDAIGDGLANVPLKEMD